MIRGLIAALLFVGVTMGVQPASAGPLVVNEMFNTGPFDCGATLNVPWQNPDWQTLYVKSVSIWMGLDKGQQSDFVAKVFRLSDGMPVAEFDMDRYGDPNGLTENNTQIAPDWVEVGGGDGLLLSTFCTPLSGPHRGHVVVNVRYTVGAP